MFIKKERELPFLELKDYNVFQKIYYFLSRWTKQLIYKRKYGIHGEYCACTKWGCSYALGCPNPARPLKINFK